MSNGNGRKAEIRQYAEDNDVSYTTALREFERVDALFAKFKAEWVRFTDYPIRLDHFDVLVSVTPTVQEPFEVNWDELEQTGSFRAMAFDMAISQLPSWMAYAGHEKYDWTANAAPYSPDDDQEAREYRVGNRVELAFRRLYGAEISATDQGDGTTFVWYLDNSERFAMLTAVDWDDIERRGAYEEGAGKIHQATDSDVHREDDTEVDKDDEPEWTPINYSDPDWAMKVTPEQFLAEQRYMYAAGRLHEKNVALLNRSEPGWYDSWLNADPLSNNGYRRRNAVTDGTVPEGVRVYNHENDAVMEFENLATGERIPVELTGTDEEMRQQAREAVGKLGA